MAGKVNFQLKMQEKQLEQQAAQYEKKNKAEKERIKKALLKGDIGSAQIAAENAIRNKNEALNAMRMAARVDGVQSRVSHVQAQQQMAKHLKETSILMSKVAKQMPLTETSQMMEALERNFEELEVKSRVMDDSMQRATTTQQPADQVAELVQQIGREINIEVQMDMPRVPSNSVTVSSETAMLEARLAKLRGSQATS